MTFDQEMALLWAESKAAPAPVEERDPPTGPSVLGKPGTRVTVSALDPAWSYAACGHPIVGTRGTISRQHEAPVGKTAVLFRYGFKAVRRNGDADAYGGSYTLFLPDACLQVQVAASPA